MKGVMVSGMGSPTPGKERKKGEQNREPGVSISE